jgi:hypothetical protein
MERLSERMICYWSKIWKQSDPSEALIITKSHENCRLGLSDRIEKIRIPKESPTQHN